MVKITNGVNVFEVTTGAYDTIYKQQGYQLIGEKEKDFMPSDNGEEKTADALFVEELRKKPLSQWGKDEVKRYAAVMDIDITGTKSVNEAKDAIRKHMSEE